MSDTELKKQILEKILAAWELMPEMRLGQLMCNVGLRHGPDDLYYVDDQTLLQRTQEFVEKQSK